MALFTNLYNDKIKSQERLAGSKDSDLYPPSQDHDKAKDLEKTEIYSAKNIKDKFLKGYLDSNSEKSIDNFTWIRATSKRFFYSCLRMLNDFYEMPKDRLVTKCS